MEAWLQTRPREVSVAFAARAALRVLPIVARDGRLKGDVFADLVLPVFGATSVAWTAAKYPAQATELEAAATRAFVAASSAAANIVDFNARHTADSAAEAANSAVQAYTAAEAAGAAAEAAYYAALAVDAVFWCAVSLDATVVEEGATASVIAGSPLWPQGQPDQLRSLWQEMKAALLAAKQDWNVWTDWYEARLRGDPAIKEFEIARATIPDEIWNQGPAKVNAEIRLVEAHEPPQPGVVELQAHSSSGASMSVGVSLSVAEPTPPRRRKKKPKYSPAEVAPPEAPLSPPSPATRFVVQQGIVDVVPPTAWAGREAQVATYHARARTIALSFCDKLANTDAEPELAASVHVVVDVLGDDPSQLQPDQLRLASRTIASKARAYGHPSARGELSVESVSTLFELADVLVSLQALASQELEEHERAIRALDLTEASVTEAKEGLDLVAEAVAVAPEIVSELASVAFEASVTASDNAADKTVQITIEGDRILLTENLALALAQGLAKSVAKGEGGRAASPSANEIVQTGPPKQRKKSKTRGQLKTTRGRANREVPNEQSWEDLKGRYIARLEAKAPEALADATLDAATSTIKHLPKTIPVLAGLVYAAIVAAPTLLAAGGGLSVSLAWIGYELWKRKKPPV